MRALILTVLLGLTFTNVSFAGYGEDLKGDCKKGASTSREAQKVMDSHAAFDKKEQSKAKSK